MLTKVENEGFEIDLPHPPPPTSTDMVPPQNDGGRWIKIFKCIGNWSKHEDEWIKEMRGNLSLVSTVIATITFQALINPPGGYIQQGLVSNKENNTSSNKVPSNVTSLSYDLLNCTTLHDNHTYCPGQAMASSPHLNFKIETYLIFVTISFFSSLSVTLLLVSGIFPMKSKALIWMTSIGMCVTLTCLATAYIAAINSILPSHLLRKDFLLTIEEVSYEVWSRLLELIVVLISLRFFIWVVKKCVKIIKKLRSWERENGSRRFLSMLFRFIVMFVVLVISSVQSLVVYSVIRFLDPLMY